ncbi:hypothetical protein HDU96_001740, partial [Phlyctochytrium bullatum]
MWCAQCTLRRYYSKGVFLLSDGKFEGCYLDQAPEFIVFAKDANNLTAPPEPLPFRNSDWVLEVKTPTVNDTVTLVNSPLGKPLYYCFAQGHIGYPKGFGLSSTRGGAGVSGVDSLRQLDHEAAAAASKPATGTGTLVPRQVASNTTSLRNITSSIDLISSVLSNALISSVPGVRKDAPLDMDVAFLRIATIPEHLWSKVDKGLMAYDLIVRNVPNPYGFNINVVRVFKVKIVWSDGATAVQITNTTDASATAGLAHSDVILPKSRGLALTFFSNYPYYAVGQISLVIYQDKLEHQRLATVVFNVTFYIALSFVFLCPLVLVGEQLIRRKRQRIAIRIVDLVHTQGPRYLRAANYTVMMSLLYFVLQWIRAASATDDSGIIPLEIFPGGLSARFFASHPSLKTLKAVVFIGLFL